MTQPLYSPNDDEIERYRKLLGVDNIVFNAHPGVLQTLASAHATDEQAVAVSQFVQSLELAKQVKLARQGGAVLDLSDKSKAYLTTIGEPYEDVDEKTVTAAQQKATVDAGKSVKGSSSGWFSSAGSFLSHAAKGGQNLLFGNPVSKTVLHGLDRAADTTRGFARMGSSGGLAANLGLDLPDWIDGGWGKGGDVAENKAQMLARGYDPGNPVSTFAYFSRGEQNYHDLSDLREKFGAENVQFAQDYIEHPESFDNPDMGDEEVVRRLKAANDPEFKHLAKLVDSRHISAGRDIANVLHVDPDSRWYTAVSGPLDAVESWYIDPTIVGGKLAQGAKLSRRGIDSLTDANGIKRVMTENKSVQRGFQMFLDDAKVIRTGTDAEKAAAYARIRVRSPDLIGMLDEVNGRRMTGKYAVKEGVGVPQFKFQDPIENLDEMTTYLTDKNGLVRMGRGLAAQKGILMPGAVSRWAAVRWGRANLAGTLAARGVERTDAGMVNYATDASKILASPGDDAVGAVNEAAQRGQYILSQQKNMRATFQRTVKRISTITPVKKNIDYYDPAAPEEVRRFASLFMPRSEANLLAAKFAQGDLASKREIYKAMFAQQMASAGLDSSLSGSRLSKAFKDSIDSLDNQAFSTVPGLDKIATDAGERSVALWLDQLNETMWLPDFAQLHRIAAKVSLYDHVLRKPLESQALDKAMGHVKAGWLTSVAGGVRNALDEDIGVTMRGLGPQVLRARLSLSQMRAMALARNEIPEAERKTIVDSVGYWSKRTRGMLNWAKSGLLSRATNDELAEASYWLGKESSQDVMGQLDGLSTMAIGNTVTHRGADEVSAITKAGYRPGQVTFRQDGWGLVPTDGGAGARAWSANLAQRFTADHKYGLKILDIVEDDTPKAREAAIKHLLTSKRQAEFRERAEIAKDLKHPDKKVARAAAADLVDKQVQDMLWLVSAKDDSLIEPLIAKIRADGTPSLDWLARNVPEASRPEHAVGRKYVAMDHEPARSSLRAQGKAIGNGYGALTAAGYELFVSKPAAWLSRHPIFMVNYTQARRNLSGYRQALEDGGMKPAIADETMHRLALQHAFDATVSMVDNPEVQSQFSVLSRGFFAFERAAEDWGRRWGRAMREDPSRIRKAQLAFEGGVHSGVIDRDDQGNPRFVYPGTGAMINAMIKFGDAIGLPVAQLPTMPDLKSNVMFLNPSLDNPVQLSLSPVAAMPLRLVQHMFPMHALGLSQTDRLLNGSLGAGRSTFESLLPTILRRPYQIMTSDEKDGQIGSAARNAIANLDAAGLTPGQKKDAQGNPIPPTDAEIENFLANVKTGAMNQLVVRALFAFFLPAAPGLPENSTGASRKVDAAYAKQGITSLKEEYRLMINKYGIDRAPQIWAELHPEALAYTVSGSETGGPYQYVSPSDESLGWMQDNLPLLKKYRTVGAYFVPTNSGEFSQPAWNAMFEIGLRQNKTLKDYFIDVRTINAEQEYYDAKDRKDKVLAEYKDRGDDAGARAIREGWAQTSQEFLKFNPLLAAKLANYGERTEWRKRAVAELSLMVEDPLSADRIDRTSVRKMIAAYNSHDTFTDQMRSKRDTRSLAAKDSEQIGYDKFMLRVVGDDPTLTKIYNGLFRGLD